MSLKKVKGKREEEKIGNFGRFIYRQAKAEFETSAVE
jgi:hypothetical protein